MAAATNGQPDPSASAVPGRVDWHLHQLAAALGRAAAPVSPELLGGVLTGMAEVVRWLVARQGEVPVAVPVLFRDDIVAEAAGMWALRLRETAGGHDGQRRRPAAAPERRGGDDVPVPVTQDIQSRQWEARCRQSC